MKVNIKKTDKGNKTNLIGWNKPIQARDKSFK